MRRFMLHALWLIVLGTAPVGAENVSWAIPQYGESPAGEDVSDVSVAADHSTTIAVEVSGVFPTAKLFHYDSDGVLRWTAELPSDCNDEEVDDIQLATFANGDTLAATSGNIGLSACIAKFDGDSGQLIWLHVDRSTSYPGFDISNVAIDFEGNVIATGRVADGDNHLEWNTRVMKLGGSDGQARWEYRTPYYAASRLLSVNGSGEIVVTVSFMEGMNFRNIGLIRLSAQGLVRWALDEPEVVWSYSTTLDDGGNVNMVGISDYPVSHAEFRKYASADGSLILDSETGTSVSDVVTYDAGHLALLGTRDDVAQISMLDTGNGTVLWHAPVSGAIGFDLIRGQNQLLAISGYGYDHPALQLQLFAADGSVLGSNPINPMIWINDLEADALGSDLILAGLSDFSPEDHNENLRVVRISTTNGQNQWSAGDPLIGKRSFRGNLNPFHAAMPFCNAGTPGLILGGWDDADSGDYPLTRPRVIKVAQQDGRRLWLWPPHGETITYGRISQTAVDANGDVLAAGERDDDDGYARALLVKLDGASGTEVWRKDGLSEPTDSHTYGVTVDTSNNVYTATLVGSTQLTRKYDGASGDLLWSASMPDSVADYQDLMVALDTSGNVTAAGLYRPASGGYAIQVAKYRGSTGEELWHRRLEEQPVGEFLKSLRLFPNGDAFVAAFDSSGYPTFRLDGNTGNPLWQRNDLKFGGVEINAAGDLFLGSSAVVGTSGRHAFVLAMDAQTGQIGWQTELPEENWKNITVLNTGIDGNLLVVGKPDISPYSMSAASVDILTGDLLWESTFGTNAYHPQRYQEPLAIRQSAEGSAFVSGYSKGSDADGTWTVFKLTGPSADDIYANGFEP